ncbi:hypothetical protein T439DRAFT_39560 [Meredithblackwellia eburnea MCA 4105]
MDLRHLVHSELGESMCPAKKATRCDGNIFARRGELCTTCIGRKDNILRETTCERQELSKEREQLETQLLAIAQTHLLKESEMPSTSRIRCLQSHQRQECDGSIFMKDSEKRNCKLCQNVHEAAKSGDLWAPFSRKAFTPVPRSLIQTEPVFQ